METKMPEVIRRLAHGGAAVVAKGLPAIEWKGELTNSARSVFWNCRKKFEWQYLRRLSPRTVEIPFLVGGLYHNGLESMYKTGRFDEEETREIVTKAVEEAAGQAALTPEQSDKVWTQQAVIMGLLRGYAKYYLADDLKKYEVLEAEASFSIPLPNGWAYRGKRDLILRRKKDKKVILTEHKSASILDANYIAKLPLDSQILGYAWSVKRDTGKLPSHVLYNVGKKTGLRLKQSETLEQYLARVENEYLENPTAYFYRELLTFTDEDVRNFETELKKYTKEMERALDEGYFYKNTTHCTAYNKTCPYMRLCIEGPTADNLVHYRVREQAHEELKEELA